MASDNILNDLWELAQKNSKEEIDEKSFKEDFSNSIYAELKSFSEEFTNINDEVNRTLLIILKQAEKNPQVLGNSNGKDFSVSSSIIAKAVKTVKFENQYIPGTMEYSQRNITTTPNLTDIILTTAVIDSMLKNYDSLPINERQMLIDNFEQLSFEEQIAFLECTANKAKELAESDYLTQSEKEDVDQAGKSVELLDQIKKLLKDRKFKDAEDLIQKNPQLADEFKKHQEENPNISKDELLEGFTNKSVKENSKIISESEKKALKRELFQLEKKEKNGEELKKDEVEKKEKFIIILNLQDVSDLYHTLEEDEDVYEYNKQIEEDKKNGKNTSRFNDFKVVENSIELNSEVNGSENLPPIDIRTDKNITMKTEDILLEDEEFSQKDSNFQQEELLEAINVYKDYFVDFDEETINELRDMDISEIRDGIRDDFIQMKKDGEISNDVYKALDVMLGNITEETKDILLDSSKREAFFEKIQSDLESQKDSELIKDSELVEIFKQASVELEVGEIKQGREDDIQDNSSLLENSHMDTEYIVNGVAMNIDEEWLQFFQDAQERGEDLEEAYENYKKEQEVEEIETKKTEERKEDKAQDEQQQEDIVVEDDGTVKIQAEEETELSAETIEVEGNEFFDLTDIDALKKSKKAKKVAVVEKDEGGNLTNVQIFKPVEFFRQSEVTTHEFEETISELTALTRDRNASEKENSEEEISQD